MNGMNILLLAAIAIFCVYRVASMSRKTDEIQRWSFILVAVGAMWVLGCKVFYTPAFFSMTVKMNEEFAQFTLYLGIFLLCADVLVGQLIRNGRSGDRRNRLEKQSTEKMIRY